jgi:putative transposase
MDQQRIDQIKYSLNQTRLKRKSQSCHVFKIKIQENKLNKLQLEALKILFIEAKWVYNDMINWIQLNDIKDYDIKVKSINVKQLNGQFINKPLKYIGSQIKQSFQKDIITSFKSLKTLKLRGHQIPGGLKFKSSKNSVNLRQYGITWKIVSSKRIKIQNIPGTFPINGLDQIDLSVYECANAKLLNTPNGYYLAITCYKTKESKITNGKELGLDFGISNNITTSEGKIYNISIQETERLKGLQKKFLRQQKGSKNLYKTLQKINKIYQTLSNQKDDAANKIVAEILQYDKVYMQDEQLNVWKQQKRRCYGRVIQASVLGRVKAKLINKENVVVLDRFVPTTKTCTTCGKKHDLALADREFNCGCGVSMDRDVHAASNMIYFGHLIEKSSGTDDLTPVDVKIMIQSNVRLKKQFSSLKQEDYSLKWQ